jgi:hypothetical protein
VDDAMTGPGAHEISAMEKLHERNEEAQVFALLAIASAINRLATAVEAVNGRD